VTAELSAHSALRSEPGHCSFKSEDLSLEGTAVVTAPNIANPIS
jgi:hypothetical protein